ncbi:MULTISPECIES: SLC13 family permease [Methylobacterium]|uniref:Sodium/sulphate symporter n=2 Tax=Methylobacterium TaxID=407 RepID=A0A1Y0ZIJ5_9HYPH|nr:anion permease [Methylobacterium aquaticum]BAR47134.1 sodium/sulphate symporter [Methylobacterium aquaticum]
MKGAVLAGCVVRLFAPGPLAPVAAGAAPAPVSAAEVRLAILLIATLVLWMTDSLHGVTAAWIGLAAACLCLLPRVGFLSGDEFAAGVNVRTCLYIAGILGFAAFVARIGLGDRVGEALLPWLPLDPARPAASVAGLLGLATVLNVVVTANGVPALFTPLAHGLAEASGLPLATVLMVQVIGYATPLLPYQASPVVVAMGMGRVPARDGLRLCLAVAAVTAVILVPLDILWFRALGWL